VNFQDARIAVLEARMSEEMASLIQRNGGGSVWSVPAVREVPLDAAQPVARLIDQLQANEIQMVVFFTGVGVKALLREADQLGRQEELITALRNVTTICRGPKPLAVLKRNDIPVTAIAPEPHTTTELLETLSAFDVAGKTVAVLHYGEKNTQVEQDLLDRGATLEALFLYEWRLPDDITELQTLVRELIAGNVDAILFTSQIQVRHLFGIATEMQLLNDLSEALQSKTIVASIGPTTTAVLVNYGVTPHIEPEHPKMGHLIKALAQYMAA
jgi:uroporphyrinogen-III synthase